MRKTKKFVASFLGLTLAMSLFGGISVFATGSISVGIRADKTSVAINDIVRVTTNATNFSSVTGGIIGYTVKVTYDSTKFTYVNNSQVNLGRVAGNILQPSGAGDLSTNGATDVGTVYVLYYDDFKGTSDSTNPIIEGDLFSLEFKAKVATDTTGFAVAGSADGSVDGQPDSLNFVDNSNTNDAVTATYSAQSSAKEKGITLTKATKFTVKINGWLPSNEYQVWTYQELSSDLVGGGVTKNWVLAKAFALPSTFTANEDGSISVDIDSFNASDELYTFAVKVRNASTKAFVEQFKETYTPENAGVTKIKKVTVDGSFADGSLVIKKIDTNSSVAIKVEANIVSGTIYSAVITSGATSDITPSETSGAFSWNTSALNPGKYTLTVKAINGGTQDIRTIPFELYKTATATSYKTVTAFSTPVSVVSNKFQIQLAPTVSSDSYFQYTISEPMRSSIFNSGATLNFGTGNNEFLSSTAYGTYWVTGVVKRTATGSADDGIINTVVNKRSGDHSLEITASATTTKGAANTLTATATIEGVDESLVEYSYWRRDAKGWVLVRDYNTTNTWDWTPSRVGDYTIQVRAKGPGALSYEVAKAVEITVSDSTDFKAALAGDISLTMGTANARTPIVLTAGATASVSANTEKLMYKYIISSGSYYYIETQYTADPTYTWIPGKAGTYSVSVLVKSDVSFGKYDAVKTFEVTVNN